MKLNVADLEIYLLYSCTSPKSYEKSGSLDMDQNANQIAGFLNQLYVQKETWKSFVFCMWVQIHENCKLTQKCLGMHCQKWVWPLWCCDSTIGCISSMNGWSKLIFGMLIEIQKTQVTSIVLDGWGQNGHGKRSRGSKTSDFLLVDSDNIIFD